ncbi:hypothetical protein UPYG_G00305300 [Umbra pygmaea]|uniref:Uncharacterized protein n=1 Tax=Umbra pygmaea TaxID=75934 RepID=A0ABD0WLA1_UMBPY
MDIMYYIFKFLKPNNSYQRQYLHCNIFKQQAQIVFFPGRAKHVLVHPKRHPIHSVVHYCGPEPCGSYTTFCSREPFGTHEHSLPELSPKLSMLPDNP